MDLGEPVRAGSAILLISVGKQVLPRVDCCSEGEWSRIEFSQFKRREGDQCLGPEPNFQEYTSDTNFI